MRCILDQRHWFEDMQTDCEDMPEGKIEYTDSLEGMSHIRFDYNLFDYTYGKNRYIYLSELLEIHDSHAWKQLMERVEEYDSITISDDVIVKNRELKHVTDFYLRVFYYQLSRHCPNCYVYRKDSKK